MTVSSVYHDENLTVAAGLPLGFPAAMVRGSVSILQEVGFSEAFGPSMCQLSWLFIVGHSRGREDYLTWRNFSQPRMAS